MPSDVGQLLREKYVSNPLYDIFFWMWNQLCHKTENQIKMRCQKRYVGLYDPDKTLVALIDLQGDKIKIGVYERVSVASKGHLESHDFADWAPGRGIKYGIHLTERDPHIIDALIYCYKRAFFVRL